MDTPHPEDSEAPLEEDIYDEFLDLLEAGEAPSVEEFLARWTVEVSADLRDRLVALQRQLGRGTTRPTEIGGLLVRGVLGSGGMGEVLAAYDPALDRDVAIKLVIPALAKNFRRVERLKKEARILAALDHPNVATVYALGGTDDPTGATLHIVMELVEGSDLTVYLGEGQRDWEASLAILDQIAAALAAAHSRQIIHRDLKPSNVMLRHDGSIKVLDFGLSSRISSAGSDRAQVASSDGTPGYMSPEQVAGAPQDERTDIWAFGCIAYELLVGSRPSEHRPLDFPVEVPASLMKLVESCLALEPSLRPVNGELLCAQLLRVREGVGRAASDAAPLPKYRTRFIDSEQRIDQVLEHLAEPGLVTLVGTAGSGKTRLAVEAAHTDDSGLWVDFTSTRAARAVEAVARSVGVREDLSLEAVARHIGEERVLLVLDNCEPLIPAAAEIVEGLLTACPQLRILATSREPLGVSGEFLLGARPLATAGSDKRGVHDAAALFLDRARAAGCFDVRLLPSGEVAAAAVANIQILCERLDGLPLAIEMAASRSATIGLKVLTERTEDSLALLRSEEALGPERHRSLENAIRASVDALDAGAHGLLLSLSAFHGGWSLTVLEDFAAARPNGSKEGVLDALAGLTRASLVVREPATARWTLLQTIRVFAANELQRDPAVEAAVHRAHTEAFLTLGERAHSASFGAERVAAFHALEADLPNFLLAIERCAAAPELAERSALLVAQLFEFWISRGLMPIGTRVLQEALDSAPGMDIDARAQCVLSLGTLAHRSGRHVEAEAFLQEAVALAQTSDATRMQAKTIRNLAFFALSQGRFDDAREGLHAALAIELSEGDPLRLGNLRNDLGILANYEGRYADAAASYSLGLELRTEAGNAWGIASSLGNLGEAYHRLGDFSRAGDYLGKSLAAFHELDDLRSVAESLEMSTSLGVGMRRFERAARLAGAAMGLREQMGFPKPLAERKVFDDELDAVREALGPDRFQTLKAEGGQATLAEVIAMASA